MCRMSSFKRSLSVLTISGLTACGTNRPANHSLSQTNVCAEPQVSTSTQGPNFDQAIESLAGFADILVAGYQYEERDANGLVAALKNKFDQFIFNLFNQPESKLGRAVDMLKVSVIEEAKKNIDDIEASILGKHREIERLRNRMVNLPENPDSIKDHILEWFGNPQSDSTAAARIADLQNQLEQLQAEKGDFIITAQSNINFALGACFTEQQVRLLLLGKEGDMFTQAVAIFKNYAPFVAQIKERLRDMENPSNQIRAKFQGAYLSLIATLRFAQTQYIKVNQEQQEKIRHVFLPQVMEKINLDKNDVQIFTSTCGQEENCQAAIQQLHANIAAREYTMRVASRYIDYLEGKKAVFQDAYRDLYPTFISAKSTYTLLKDASTLADEMDASITMFLQIDSLELPEIHYFSLNVSEFEKIAAQLE